jgi:predicted  nucleic acid-binding Zn-ribbon protein
MLDEIEKLLILQDRDRKVAQIRGELAEIEPQRQAFKTRTATAQNELEAAKLQIKHLESDRKKLELEVEAKKQLIERYSLQQFETRKNDEYRALAHEIETCKEAITKTEDQELEIMEQAESAQKSLAAANQMLTATTSLVEGQIADLNGREASLKNELAELESGRTELASAVGENVRARYERLFKAKGGSVVVGVHHGVCGGCHMKLPPQLLVHCQAQQEVITCPNCGRILYYTRDMDLAVAE